MGKKFLWSALYIILWGIGGLIAILSLAPYPVALVIVLPVFWLWAVINIYRVWKKKDLAGKTPS
ncbi:hypothetical protein [Asticcacaulis sp.]|uniref:hypothetical protein n=1 Tax=Asticcacaulis sp. TaxID=1872648 RepID=UPI003F7CB830